MESSITNEHMLNKTFFNPSEFEEQWKLLLSEADEISDQEVPDVSDLYLPSATEILTKALAE